MRLFLIPRTSTRPAQFRNNVEQLIDPWELWVRWREFGYFHAVRGMKATVKSERCAVPALHIRQSERWVPNSLISPLDFRPM